MTIKSPRKSSLVTGAALLAVLALTLTGCGSSSNANQNSQNNAAQQSSKTTAVYEFQSNVYGTEPNQELTVKLPDGLIQAAKDAKTEGIDTLAVKEFNIKARKLDNSAYCAMDINITYNPGGKDQVIASRQENPNRQWFLPIVPGANQTSPVKSQSDFNSTSPESGLYVPDNLDSATIVQSCASSVDEAGSSKIYFPIKTSNQNNKTALATAKLNVMKSGTIGVVEPEVFDFTKDSQGNWIKG